MLNRFAVFFSLFLSAATTLAAPAESFSITSFEKALQSKDAFVVAFHSDSCGSCKVQKPNLQSVLKEERFKPVRGLMADFDQTAEFRKKLGHPVRLPSTILVFKEGREVGRIQGETRKDQLRELIGKYI